jgi:hypothetical protein
MEIRERASTTAIAAFRGLNGLLVLKDLVEVEGSLDFKESLNIKGSLDFTEFLGFMTFIRLKL